MNAIIYKSTGSWYLCKTDDGTIWNGRMKGKFKIDKEITSTNPIAVGDHVQVELESESEKSVMITAIEKRKNYLVRVSPHNKNQKHIVASNLDQSILIATIKDPRTSTGFIDRFLVSCEVYHLEAIIVFNKSDILDEEDINYYQYLKDLYSRIGYKVYLVSAEKDEGIESLKNLMQHKVTLLTGHSGVGKSTLINKILPEKDLFTQEVSAWCGKGMHTTTFAQMYDLPDGGQLIDTPGIRELGIVNVSRAELSGYFPEMKRELVKCKYNNCTHFNEPGCAVKQAVAEGIISEERYVNYAKIYETIEEKWS